ncbi:acyl-CoA synthetase FdrA [Facklamia hominis]|uniref:DUF1116 domain-containing protein n=1 Tax=Facklamia hominis TaxID=178214 RepID=UPI0029D41277|nr:acyl-CoA synthetase FdrA [Facklamia hominis]WPJ90644.1 acyl-CoA synthetase FdrA [Facklamia hominis]
MLQTHIIRNSYQDSINLMLLTNEINSLDNVVKSQVMMGTDANKDILLNTQLLTEEAKEATPNDLMIVVDSDDANIIDVVLNKVEEFLSDLSVKSEDNVSQKVSSLDEALEILPEANLALFSIPGEYATPEIHKALDHNLHVFSFTDNIPLEDEVALKEKAQSKGLLMMGPDCGTGIISNIPLAFTNVVSPGNIGIVGASGTGIQEVSTIIDRLGGGVMHAIGTGGRDLKSPVGALTTKEAILALEYHEPTDVICVISKPPAKEVREDVLQLLQSISKPVVAIFLGEKPEEHVGNVYLAHTLEEAARISLDLSNGNEVKNNYLQPLKNDADLVFDTDKVVIGLYSGGTLANEAGMMISEALGLEGLVSQEGYILKSSGYDVLDLGDDIYTQGRPHPMIDPHVRIDKIKEYASHENTGVILFDVVLGYGCHDDMADALIPTIKEVMEEAKAKGRTIKFIATVVGTDKDPQDYLGAVRKLEEAGVLVEASNQQAVRLALKFKGIDFREPDKPLVAYDKEKVELHKPSEKIMNLLNSKPKVVNIGLKSFNDPINTYGGTTVQYDWKPKAGGNKRMIKLLDALEPYADEIDRENKEVAKKLKDAQPFLMDVVPAKSVIPQLNDPSKKTLLHAGPPIQWEEMTGPMKGSCVGAALFEKWASTEDEAYELLEKGEVSFLPCHHADAVGPMGGITSANMPVLVVENKLSNNRAYCTMNEGIGKVLRFGAFSDEVITRLEWMRDTLGPVLSEALRSIEGGMNLNVLISKAITMGDEFHQRNIAASLNFLKEITPYIVQLEIDESDKYDVIKFLADTDQFFLNIMMATGKAIVDAARKDARGTLCTTLTRNGVNFGIRISETNDDWYTAPVNNPRGLYFTGYTAEDGNPDIGDSAITETVGVGGMAMIAAPGVTRFVGAGGFQEAINISNEMSEITIDRNPGWSIPNWDFEGSLVGIDIRKVVETGITPIINTGIAHKNPGVGQVGAGTVRAPLKCFEKALEAYAKTKGIELE